MSTVVHSSLMKNVLSPDCSEYAGQPVGVVVAESRELAIQAAKLVQVVYKNEKPVVTGTPLNLSKNRAFFSPL